MSKNKNTAAVSADILAALQVYVIAMNALMAAYYAATFPSLTPTVVCAELRQKYAKIINGGSVYSWIDLTTGDVLKGTSKGVESAVKHIKRGNILDGSWLDWHGPHGIGYADRHGEFAFLLGRDVVVVAKDSVQAMSMEHVTAMVTTAIAERVAARRAVVVAAA